MNLVYQWVVSLELQLTEQKTSKKHPCSRCLVIWSVRMPIRYWTWQEEGGVSKTNEWWIGTVPEFGLKSCCSFVKWFVANLFCHWGIVPRQDLSDFYNHSKETLGKKKKKREKNKKKEYEDKIPYLLWRTGTKNEHVLKCNQIILSSMWIIHSGYSPTVKS